MSDKPDTEAQPVEAEPSAQEPQSLDDMTPEALAAEIDRRANEGGFRVVPTEHSGPDEPVEAEAESEATEPDAGVEEEAEQVEVEEPTNGEAEEDRLTKLERLVQQAELKREAEAAKNEHLRFMLDRKRGELQHVRSQMRQPQAEESYQDDTEYRSDVRVDPLVNEARSEILEMKRERAQTAAVSELQRLQSAHADFWNSLDKTENGERKEFEQSFSSKLANELQSLGLQESAGEGDVKRTGSIVRAAYTAALAETRLEWLGKIQAKRRSAPPPSEASRKRKLAAASGSSSNRPTVAPKPKSLEEMTAEEIKAEIDRRDALGIRVD